MLWRGAGLLLPLLAGETGAQRQKGATRRLGFTGRRRGAPA